MTYAIGSKSLVRNDKRVNADRPSTACRTGRSSVSLSSGTSLHVPERKTASGYVHDLVRINCKGPFGRSDGATFWTGKVGQSPAALTRPAVAADREARVFSTRNDDGCFRRSLQKGDQRNSRSVSRDWTPRNSMATPSWKWRTIRPRILPSSTGVPSSKRNSVSTAAPESERSMMRQA